MLDQGSDVLAGDPFSVAIAQQSAETLEMVRQALQAKDVALAYQPVVGAKATQNCAFYEGLLRVLDRSGRIIPARDFIYVIEPLEEGRLMDCLALEMGLEALARNPQIRLSINMSARSIGDPRWDRALEAGMRMDPSVIERLIIEITESSAMLVPDAVAAFMERLHTLGASFALDDFGAGFTSFRHFKDFYFDIVKIDATFVQNIHMDADNQVLTQALASIAQQFDMFTVAEGVERHEEAHYLAAHGIDCLQGYFFAAPTLSEPWKQLQTRAGAPIKRSA